MTRALRLDVVGSEIPETAPRDGDQDENGDDAGRSHGQFPFFRLGARASGVRDPVQRRNRYESVQILQVAKDIGDFRPENQS